MLFISSCGFELQSVVITLLWYSSILHSSIIKYIICLCFIVPKIQFYNYCFMQWSFKAVKRRNASIVFYVYVRDSLNQYPLFFGKDLHYHLESFPISLYETSIRIFCKEGLLAINSFNLCLSGSVFISPSFLKYSFAGCQILFWQIFHIERFEYIILLHFWWIVCY